MSELSRSSNGFAVFAAAARDDSLDVAALTGLFSQTVPTMFASRPDLPDDVFDVLFTSLVVDRLGSGDPFGYVHGQSSVAQKFKALVFRSLDRTRRVRVYETVRAHPGVCELVTLYGFAAYNPPASPLEWDLFCDAACLVKPRDTNGVFESFVVSPHVPVAAKRRLAAQLTFPNRVRFVLDHPGELDDDVELLCSAKIRQAGPGSVAMASTLAHARPELVSPLISRLLTKGAFHHDYPVLARAFLLCALAPWRDAPERVGDLLSVFAAAASDDTRVSHVTTWPPWAQRQQSVLSDPTAPPEVIAGFLSMLDHGALVDPWKNRGSGDRSGWCDAAKAMLAVDSTPWPAVFAMITQSDDVARVVASRCTDEPAESPYKLFVAATAGEPVGQQVSRWYESWDPEVLVRPTADLYDPQDDPDEAAAGAELVACCGARLDRWRLALELVGFPDTVPEACAMIEASLP